MLAPTGGAGVWRYIVILTVLVIGAAAGPRAQERPLRTMTVPTLVTTVAFSPDGETLTAWDPSGFSRWTAANGRLTGREPVFAKACERAPVLPRSANGRVVAANCRNRLVFFEAATAAPLGELALPDKQTAAVYSASANGKAAAIVPAGEIDTIRLGDLTGGTPAELRIGQEVAQLTFDAAGTRLTVGSWQGVEVREVPGGELLRTLKGQGSHALSADGRLVAIVSGPGATLFDAASGDTIREVEGRVSHLRFGGGASRLVGWTNQRVVVWDVATGAQRLVLTGEEFVDAAISPDGSHLATVTLNRRGERTTSTLAVWRLPVPASR